MPTACREFIILWRISSLHRHAVARLLHSFPPACEIIKFVASHTNNRLFVFASPSYKTSWIYALMLVLIVNNYMKQLLNLHGASARWVRQPARNWTWPKSARIAMTFSSVIGRTSGAKREKFCNQQETIRFGNNQLSFNIETWAAISLSVGGHHIISVTHPT